VTVEATTRPDSGAVPARLEDVALNITPDEIAAQRFLVRYQNPTRDGYALSLKQWFEFCQSIGERPLQVERAHVELWIRALERKGLMASTINGKLNAVCGFYKLAKIDRDVIDDPTEHIRRPKVPQESRREGLNRAEGMACLDAAQQAGPLEHALWCVLLLLGPRASEVCALNVESIGKEQGQPVIFMDRAKGNRSANVPLVPRAAWAIELYLGTRSTGPLFLKPRKEERLDPASSNRIVKRVARAAGITKTITNHSLRHSAITAALNGGASMRDLQNSMGYADMRQLSRYDRDKSNLARHSTHIVSTYFEGG
jgi:integrase/recombinase XerD